MKALLISVNTEQINMRTLPLGLECVAAATRRNGHEVLVLDLVTKQNVDVAIKNSISDFSPDVIGLSIRNIDDQKSDSTNFLLEGVKKVVAHCRAESEAPLVLGGAGYSIFPDSVLAFLGADMGIKGEGEVAFPALLRNLEQGLSLSGLPGLLLFGKHVAARASLAEDLDNLPLPDDSYVTSLTPSDENLWIPVQSRRGCAMNCSYCSTAAIEGLRTRKRSPKIVIDWISRIAGKGFKRFYFVDNNFNFPPSHALEICRQMATADLGVTWRCILNPLYVDEELVRALALAGCKEVSLGFESGSDQILKQMNKRFSLDEVRRISSLLLEHEIERMGFLLLGGPGETKDTVEESLDFADSLGLDAVKVTAGIRIYPNTSLYDIAVDQGIIAPNEDLLSPRFYFERGLEDWLKKTIEHWKDTRPNWIF